MSETTVIDTSVRLDHVTLETRAAHLPESMRENLVWLGAFVRDACNRDFEILTQRMTDLGYKHEKSTWSKVLKGQWQHDAKGRRTEFPIISEDRFNRAVNALRKDEAEREQMGAVPFVNTPTARSIQNYLTLKRLPERVCKFGVVIGETGTQKTASFKEYRRLNNHGTTALVEAPERPSMGQFMTDLAREFGYSTQSGYQKKKDYVLQAVKRRTMIIVDNVQRLYDPKFKGNQPIFNFLQKLQEDTGCTIIICFTPTFEKTFTEGFLYDDAKKRYSSPKRGADTFFEQFIGRAGGIRSFLRLPEYPTEADVEAIATALRVRGADNKAAKAELYDLACEPGRIRRLFEVLQQAKADADAEGQPLHMNHVRAALADDQNEEVRK